MIEATCGACGTVARIAEADVPSGAKFVTCASCKSRVPLPQKAGAPTGAIPKPPAVPGKIPAIPSPSTKPTMDLADLPAPKRNSPLAGTAAPSKPAPASALAGADLPAPKSAAKAAPSALDLDDLMPSDLPAPKGKSDIGLADLPAPKPRPSPLGDAGPSKPAPSALADLPAPKAKPSALADLPAPKAKPSALADLPAPKPKAGPAGLPPKPDAGGLGAKAADLGAKPNLPAKPTADIGDLPGPKAKPDLADLPAPKKTLDLDLPAPKRPSQALPPVQQEPHGISLDDDFDLPMPKAELPMPKAELPMLKPGANGDLPMVKPGAEDDLLTPRVGDLPAPKGFFDDLPQPAKKQGGIDLPAPKGFFDDLPQPATSSGKPELPAPKGFFDDLPQPAKTDSAKGGFFDDLPQPTKPASAKSGGLFDDIGSPSSGDIALGDGDLDLGGKLELDGGPSAGPNAGPELDLGLPLGQDADFTDLDLSEPTAKSGRSQTASPMPIEPGSPIKIKTPKGGGGPSAPIPITVKKDEKQDLKLDLADDPHAGKPGAAAAAAGGKAATKRAQKSPEEIAEESTRKKKRSRVVLASVLGVALLGGGGFYFYKKHAAAQEKADEIATQIATARRQLADAHPQHWQRASGAAQAALELEPNHGVALGLAAEAALAGALDNGVNYQARVAQGRKLTQDGLGAGKRTPELERAQALMLLAANQPDRAVDLLNRLIAQQPRDGWLQLYLGWSQLGKGDADAAITAFNKAVELAPATKLPALFGHGKAKLLEADIEGARTAFTSVLEQDKAHIGAQVGLAATLPPQQSAQREADLLAILERPDIKTADPRAVVQAYTLVGDLARTSGRLDIARERYNKALAISALDIPATVGLAAVELKDGKTQVAADLLAKATSADANNADVQLLAAEVAIVDGRLPDAETILQKLGERQPPLATLQLARMHVVKGKLLELQGKTDEAVAEYSKGAKVAGELDLMPTMQAVRLLSDLAKKAADPAKATEYRTQADGLLSALAARAQEDAELSLALGVAYLQSGDAVKAEQLIARAATMREKDPEARLQLGKALVAQGKNDDAIRAFKEALDLDPKRNDIALELARTYQATGRDTEAMAAYDKLLADPAVPVIVRVNAGKYFATKGARDKAAAQAEPILKAEPDNAGGLYLKAEGLMLAGKWDEARITLTRATDLDQTDAQYLDALGRALEGSLKASNDTKYVEGARHAYERATKADPNMLHPHIGLGRMLVAAGKWEEAIKALGAASALDKNNAEVMYNMGLAFYGVRNQSPAHKATAAQWLEASMKNSGALTPEMKAEGYWRLGQLYTDLNKGGQAAAALENALKTAEDTEKNGGNAPDWLVESYHQLGLIYYGLNNKPAQKRAWQRYVDRKPRPSERLSEAQQALNTYLKGL